MASPSVATRNTCFAIISAIEDDFRALIRTTCEATAIEEILPPDVREVANKRKIADSREQEGGASSDIELLNYIDFADISKIIDAQLSKILKANHEWLKLTSQQLLSLAPARNRVCHTRPLEAEDLASCLDFSKRLTNVSSPFVFATVTSTLRRLESEPTFVLTLQIPQFWSGQDRAINHNLPLPEFDETGFLGRSSDRVQLGKLINSHYPIVTVVGEGGIGKTALALRCLYDLIDDPNAPFDAVVWVSLKTASLTQAGVQEISGAITSTLGLLGAIAENLGVPKTAGLDQKQLISEIVAYLTEYRILVAIDNLETISTGPLRDLLTQLPSYSKLLITSRIGMGEFEVRYALGAMDEKTALTLMRTFAKVLSIGAIIRAAESDLVGYCRKLFLNPLLIKWFVSSVGRGAEPIHLINKHASTFGAALEFCFENLFKRLSDGELKVINTLACARKSLSAAEMHFLNEDMSHIEAEQALGVLHNSSIVTRKKGGGDGFEYELSESALSYLSNISPPPKEMLLRVHKRLRELRQVLEQSTVQRSHYKYEIFSVKSSASQDHRIAAVYLRRALDALKSSNLANARSEVLKACSLAPGYAEVWRITAIVESHVGEIYRARENYEQAISIDPGSTLAKYTYAMFLISQLDDPEHALEQILQAELLDPKNSTLLTVHALAFTRLGRYSEAAEIYEELLKNVDSFPRRWRISTVDQAAECYRRWAEFDKQSRDVHAAKLHCQQGLEILRASVFNNNFDTSSVKRIARLVDEALSAREVLDDEKYIEWVISTAEEISRGLGAISIPVIHFCRHALLTLMGAESFKERLIALDNENANRMAVAQGVVTDAAIAVPSTLGGISKDDGSGEYKEGRVHNVPPGAAFGFIVDQSARRWFFHINFLQDRRDWSRLDCGQKVKFREGSNEKGACAVDIIVGD